ncbi:cyclic nucleotide-binding domain-containing protein [Myxococcota bacterium]|nr:cyclic nucleotide-binding domain-containing protein [Myxococcota bacterium]
MTGASARFGLFASGLSAGLVAGLRTVLGSTAMVALLLPASLGAGVPQTLVAMLIGGAVLAALTAMLSGHDGVVAQVQDAPAAILGAAAATIVSSDAAHLSPDALVTVVLAATNVAALVTGLAFFALGRARLGGLVRFVPYPVIGGFLAGSGLLIVLGAVRVLAGTSVDALTLEHLTDPMGTARWLPGLVFGVSLLVVLRSVSHVLLVPGLLVGGIALYHLGLHAAGLTIADARAGGLLLGGFTEATAFVGPAWVSLDADGWWALAARAPTFAAVALVSAVALLLNATGLELATDGDLDVDRELRAAGVANVVSGLAGGMVGFHSLSASLLGHKMGASTRVVGLTTAAACLVAAFAGASLVGFVPKAILGGLLFTMGASLLVEWLWDGRTRLSRTDHAIVAVIVLAVAVVGISWGVLVGIAVAMALFVLAYSRVRVIRRDGSLAELRSTAERSAAETAVLEREGGVVRILELEGFIFFGTAHTLLTRVRERLDARALTTLVLDVRAVRALDSSALSTFAKIVKTCARRGVEVVVTRASADVRRMLERGAERPRFEDDLDVALDRAEERVLAAAGAPPPSLEPIWTRIHAALPAHRAREAAGATAPGAALRPYLQPRIFARGERILEQGGPPDELVFIESGRVSVRVASPDGGSVRVASMTAGTIVGELGFYRREPRSADVVADEATAAYVLTRARLAALDADDPALAAAIHTTIITLLTDRLARTLATVARPSA